MQTSAHHPHPRTPLRHLLVVARKGQITIPAPIRDALHIKVGDTVAVELQGEEVKITPVPVNWIIKWADDSWPTLVKRRIDEVGGREAGMIHCTAQERVQRC